MPLSCLSLWHPMVHALLRTSRACNVILFLALTFWMTWNTSLQNSLRTGDIIRSSSFDGGLECHRQGLEGTLRSNKNMKSTIEFFKLHIDRHSKHTLPMLSSHFLRSSLPVVIIDALEDVDVQCNTSRLSKRLEDMRNHLTRECANHFPLQSQVDVCEGSSRNVHNSP